MLATWRRRLPAAVVGVPIVFVVCWVLFFASGTPAGAAVDEPGEFLVTLLDGVTFAGLMFVVASGFTLIFGLMRTVNMAHGALFLLAAYIAIDLQQNDGRQDAQHRARRRQHCVLGHCRCSSAQAWPRCSASIIQQVFLRWNQGQDLRQALITVAISVIVADQLLARFGGLAQRMIWPGPSRTSSRSSGKRYATSRLFMLGVALVVGCPVVAVAQPRRGWASSSVPGSTTRQWSARSASTSASSSP